MKELCINNFFLMLWNFSSFICLLKYTWTTYKLSISVHHVISSPVSGTPYRELTNFWIGLLEKAKNSKVKK